MSTFTWAQTPGLSVSNTQSDAQQKLSEEINILARETITVSPASPVALEKIGKGVSAPDAIKTPQAKYTREARKKKVQGICLVSIIVDANGIPRNSKVIRPVGYGLDEAALEAIKKYRFKPAMKSGQPVAVQMSIEVNFRLY